MGNTSTAPTITDGDLRKILAGIDAEIDKRAWRPEANGAMAALISLHTGMTAGEVCGLDYHDCRTYPLTQYGAVRVTAAMRDRGTRRPQECATSAQWREIKTGIYTIRRVKEFARRHYVTRGDPHPVIASYANSTMGGARHIAWSRPARVGGTFRAMCEREGLGTRYTFASLRRTHAAMLLRAGVPVDVVAARLGIADAARVAAAHGAECAEGEGHRAEWAARVEDMRLDAIWGSIDAEGRAAADTFADAMAALVAG